MILVNIINNENLNHFSSLTIGKVRGLTICLETVKLMEYGIKEINRELFKIEVEHLESSVLFKIVLMQAISSNIIVKSRNIQAEHSWTFNLIIIEAIIWLIFLGTDVKIV